MTSDNLPSANSFATAATIQPLVKMAQGQMMAMGQIARISAEAMRQVMQQQQALYFSAMGRIRDAGQGGPLEMARAGTEIALRNAGELAEIARQAQIDMLSVLSDRANAVTETASDAIGTGIKDTRQAANKVADKAEEIGSATLKQAALAGQMVE